MDLKKEIKLSDLFRRNGEGSAAEDEGGSPAPKEKKERRLFARAPKEPKPTSNGKGRFGADPKAAPPVPAIPLMRAFDLLPKDHARRDAERRPGLAYIALALAAVIALGALGGLFLMTSGSLNDKRTERDQLRAQLAALEVAAEEPSAQPKPELEQERLARTTALATALSGRVAWDRLLREISLVLPDDVYLTTLTVQSPKPAATPAATTTAPTAAAHFAIAGTTEEQSDVALLLSRLTILPELTGVQLVSSTRGDNREITFTINAAVRHEASSQ